MNINKVLQWNCNKYIQVLEILSFVSICRGGVYTPTNKLIRVFVHQFAYQTKFSCIDRAVFRRKHFSNYPMAQSKWFWVSASKAHKTI